MASGLVDLLGGTFGGIATVAVGQPLDTIKVKLQTFPHLYPNAMSCFRKTIKADGIRGLYAGTVPSLAANVAENAVLFAAFGTIQRLIVNATGKKSDKELTTLENGTAGFFAAFFSSFTLCPTELVKCRLQASQEYYNSNKATMPNLKPPERSPFRLTAAIFRKEGIRGFFHGLTPTFVREMPGYAAFFASYDYTRSLFVRDGGTKDDIGLPATMFAGGVGGTCLWALIFPADMLKSRLQVMQAHSEVKLSAITVTQTILRVEGVRAFYRGLGPTLLRTFPATGALFLAYEMTKKYGNLLLE